MGSSCGSCNGSSSDEARDPSIQEYELLVETFNSTSWSTMKARLSETSAHILLGQEVHIVGLDAGYASGWARNRGWKCIIEQATPGKQEPFSLGGVAIFVRDWLGLSEWPTHPDDNARGRLVSGLLEAPGYGSILLVSAYVLGGRGKSG